MRKTKEVLSVEVGVGAGAATDRAHCGMGLARFHDYLERAAAAGIGCRCRSWSEEELKPSCLGTTGSDPAARQRPQPDWNSIHEQLQQHRHLTLQLVWEEYRQANPQGYRYVVFERYQHGGSTWMWCCVRNTKAGEKMFVDWAGANDSVYDATTGQAWPILFVRVGGPVLTPMRSDSDRSCRPGSKHISTRWNLRRGTNFNGAR